MALEFTVGHMEPLIGTIRSLLNIGSATMILVLSCIIDRADVHFGYGRKKQQKKQGQKGRQKKKAK